MLNIEIVFWIYSIIGLLIVIFNKQISHLFYNLVLYFTNKLRLKELFLFRIDRANQNSMFSLMKTFTIMFGLMILGFSIYYIFYKL